MLLFVGSVKEKVEVASALSIFHPQCCSYRVTCFKGKTFRWKMQLFMFHFFVEKPSTAPWTRALLHKHCCQHTTTQCSEHTTQKMTSLSAKLVWNCALLLLPYSLSTILLSSKSTTHCMWEYKP